MPFNKQPLRGLILANGQPPSKRLLKKYIGETDLFVCADGGLNAAAAYNLLPDAVVGDLDSAAKSALKRLPAWAVFRETDENSTDLEKAVLWLTRRGFGDITILGATGRRADHTFGNFGVLPKFAEQAVIRSADDEGVLEYVGRSFTLSTRKGEVISLLPLTRCDGIVTSGLKYPLKNETLMLGARDGTSNVALGTRVTITVRKGHLLVYRARQV